MSHLSIPLHFDLPRMGVAPIRPWLKYHVELRSLERSDGSFTYLVESGAPTIMGEENLGAELFNAALSKVDITDNESLLEFVRQYGIPTSPIYEGHQRLAWFRNRDAYAYRPARDEHGLRRDDDYRYAAVVASFDSAAKTHGVNPITGETMRSVYGPVLLSEAARDKEAKNEDVAGVVSVLEIAQTIRLMQCASATCSAYQAECEKLGEGNIEKAAQYVENKRFLDARGARYFLDNPDLQSFDERLETDSEFSSLAEKWKTEENAARTYYGQAQIAAFHDAAERALAFLQNACLVSNLPLSIQDETNPLASGFIAGAIEKGKQLLKHGSGEDQRDELLDCVAQYGSLTEAIIRQYLSLFNMPSPWQQCENCGRLFKRPKGAKPGRKLRVTRFCSRSCNVSFNQKKEAAE